MDDISKKKKTTQITIIVAIVLVTFFFTLQMLIKKPAIDKNMLEAANEINKMCPIMVDSVNRFDNAAALTNNVFQFNYTILNADKSNYDTTALKNIVRPATLNTLKTNPKYKIFRDNNTVLSFIYHDKNSAYLCSMTVSISDTN